MIHGRVVRIALETAILFRRGLDLRGPFHTAGEMSLVSMPAMKIAMNAVDGVMTGRAR